MTAKRGKGKKLGEGGGGENSMLCSDQIPCTSKKQWIDGISEKSLWVCRVVSCPIIR